MKNLLFTAIFALVANLSPCQTHIPSPAEPCAKLDTDKIKNLMLGTWVDIKDSTHIITVTDDSVEETVVIQLDGKNSTDQSFWNYRFTDNIFSTDAVTCYSLVEFKPDFDRKQKVAINYIDSNYMLLGAEGKTVFRRKR